MTETEKSLVRYLEFEDIQAIYEELQHKFENEGEPIPPFSTAHHKDIDALVKIPQSEYFGKEQYPALESKAAILFYTINKKHIFLNANKRMSIATLLVFLFINHKRLSISEDALTDKAIWLAETTHSHDFDEIKLGLEEWIAGNMREIEISI